MVWLLLRLEPVRTIIQYQKNYEKGNSVMQITPRKIKMEPKIHQIEKENNLPNHHVLVSMLSFQGVLVGYALH